MWQNYKITQNVLENIPKRQIGEAECPKKYEELKFSLDEEDNSHYTAAQNIAHGYEECSSQWV